MYVNGRILATDAGGCGHESRSRCFRHNQIWLRKTHDVQHLFGGLLWGGSSVPQLPDTSAVNSMSGVWITLEGQVDEIRGVLVSEWCMSEAWTSDVDREGFLGGSVRAMHEWDMCQLIASAAYSLPIHCLFTAYSLPLHCLFTTYSLPIHCLFNVYSMSIHCVWVTHEWRMSDVHVRLTLIVRSWRLWRGFAGSGQNNWRPNPCRENV
jgi:hypothetical protein